LAVLPEAPPAGAPRAGSRNRRRFAGLRTRAAAAAVLGPCCLVVAWRGDQYFVLLVNLLLVTGMYEYVQLARAKGLEPDAMICFAAALALPWAMYMHAGSHADEALGGLFVWLVLRALLRWPVRDAMPRLGVTILGVMYVAWLGAHLVLLRQLPLLYARDYQEGFRFVFATLVLVWLSDTAAYFVGSLFGRRRLALRISPGKSVEGAVGALVFCGAAGSVLALTVLPHVLTPVSGAGMGVLASFAGQIGDLLASLLKRDAQVKDTSHLIPGHGGVLDRFDSLLLAGPVLYYALLALL
jgi:phosphatidate cytidylyltransferase